MVSTGFAITIVVTLGVFMLGTVLAVVLLLGARIESLSTRLDHQTERIDHLAEDVAVLKATS